MNLPVYIPLVFAATTLLTVFLFYRASGNNRVVLFLLAGALTAEAATGLTGFFTVTDTLPPRLFLIILPPLALVITVFTTARGRRFIDSLDLKTLTLLHAIRIPVELVLFWLFLNRAMPELMTFEGRNIDILSGLSAPLVFYFGFVKKQLHPKLLLAWNVLCLVILAFTVTNAILSAPTPFQQFAFDQPAIAVLYFPFVWLPGVVVPLVYFSHLVAIRRLMKENTQIVSC